jgi:hypothetical protein
LRHAAYDQHDTGRTERLGLIDGARRFVVARLAAMRSI